MKKKRLSSMVERLNLRAVDKSQSLAPKRAQGANNQVETNIKKG